MFKGFPLSFFLESVQSETETRPLKSDLETKTNLECYNASMNTATEQHKIPSIHSFMKPEK